MRIGHGYDVHRFSDDPDRPCVLGGEVFPGVPGLAGHSDADAVCHAVIDALFAAAGLGDIGQHFPDTDPRYAGADSAELLGVAVAELRSAGWSAVNVDCTVVAERPKLASARDAMQARLTGLVGAPVTVKGRRAEGLGPIGEGLGVEVHAVALIDSV